MHATGTSPLPPLHHTPLCPLPLQGLNQLMWCLPTGGFDPRRHASWEACARAE